jgi:error-prone DNA polymerase
MPAFAELAARSNFSFLDGASHPEELVATAGALGLAGLGIADRNTLAGVVRGHVAVREFSAGDVGAAAPRFAVGCRLAFTDGTPDVLAWPTDRASYGRLCRLLTVGNMRGETSGDCRLGLDDLLGFGAGLVLAPVAGPRPDARLAATLEALGGAFPGAVRLAAAPLYRGDDRRRIARFARLAAASGAPLLATNDPLYHHPGRRPLQDVVTAIRLKTTLAAAGRRLAANAERHLKPAAEMARLFTDVPEALTETLAVLERLGFSLEMLAYEYPDEPVDPGSDAQATLERLAREGAARRYPGGVPAKVASALAHELELIGGLRYAPYFLTVHDIVRFARSRGILAQGRGSAANSAICYCLGITEVDPETSDPLFERFVSAERGEPPDIDVDFEHARREEVIQYVYARYGRDRAGIAATVISYRGRSAAREVGKAFGLSEDAVSALAGTMWGWSAKGAAADDARRAGLDPADPTVAKVLALSQEIAGFPRHLSQHVGGFVVTRGRLDELVPIRRAAMDGRTIVEWDKDDLDALKILKIDVLALGMLTCLRRALDLVAEHYGDACRGADAASRRGATPASPAEEPLALADIPAADEAVYRMLSRADSVGVFQVESRAQMSMLPRLKPRTFYDLVIEVAIVRPGPIQGDMVHPYLRRRQGLEKADYPKPRHGDPNALRDVLGKTLGVPLFQEQAMRIAIVAAGFRPAEADQLRRAMATFKRTGTIGRFREKFLAGMAERGYEADFAAACFRQIEGFGDYGFPESHAASFALLVYASAWIKCRYPDVFAAALLDAQPMGFYAPAQIVRDAREHGVRVEPPDVNLSAWKSTLVEEAASAELSAREPAPLVGEGERAPRPGSAHPAVLARLHRRHADMAGDIRARHALRLGLSQVKGLAEADAERIVARRGAGYDSLRDVWLRTGLPRAVLERLAEADAFRSLGLDRRAALWAARGLDPGSADETLPLLARAGLAAAGREPEARLPPMPLGAHVVEDYRTLSLSLKAHPASFVRAALDGRGILPAAALADTASGRRVAVAGLVLIRQRPGTASGVIFMTLEDETGIANLIVWPKVFERFRSVVLGARFVVATGRLQSESGVVHLIVERLVDGTARLAARLGERRPDLAPLTTRAPADHVRHPGEDAREKATEAAAQRRRLARPEEALPAAPSEARRAAVAGVLPRGRNFH